MHKFIALKYSVESLILMNVHNSNFNCVNQFNDTSEFESYG